ncbi:ser/Thr protein phosphatase family protein [Patellaria atrata CBS 101060]|uniref:Ser/Thr protein phosphatase family protein n=1 Tax=Patellaria atrata CBS 101060 TaxID=1346257 RepID=A0A9P4SCK6_9PEZI|nr:ser/Thr protein phosphatase family protein [Patellaria atrata CBS 101060]
MTSNSSTAGDIITFSSGHNDGPPDVRILHYNDVYHIDASSAEPVGGVARFQTVANHYRNDEKFAGQSELLTFFSGDAFNPSLESSVTKGSHMVPFLNSLGTDCAAVGNHDLDFGVRQYRHLTAQCKFPWLLANVLDPALGEDVPLGNAGKTHIITTSNGIKIGIIGLGEREWLDTINSLPPDLIYKSASQTAKELIPGLKEQGAEMIVAITHQREPNDNKLAEKVDGIDLILGGHDHFYAHSFINGTHVLRSGSDFKQLSYLEARRKSDEHGWHFEIIRRDIVSEIPQDAKAIEMVEKLTATLKAKLEKPIGYTSAPLDARFTTVRLKESNYGNFVCDLMRQYYNADCGIMAGGTIRGDQIYPPGILRLKDIMNCFPFEDPVVVLRVKGKAIIEALENSVSKYPALEGRFSQISNIKFAFDPEKPEGSRVTYTKIGNKPVDLEKDYSVATRGYMGRGKDGFDSLLIKSEGGVAEEIVSEENGILISMMLRQYFMSLKVLGRWKQWGPSMGRHWGKVQQGLQSSHPVHEPTPPSHSVVESLSKPTKGGKPSGRTTPHGTRPEGEEAPLDESESEVDSDSEKEQNRNEKTDTKLSDTERELVIIRKVMRKWWRLAGLPGNPALADELGEGEFGVHWTKAVAPRLEGRIRIVGGYRTDEARH